MNEEGIKVSAWPILVLTCFILIFVYFFAFLCCIHTASTAESATSLLSDIALCTAQQPTKNECLTARALRVRAASNTLRQAV